MSFGIDFSSYEDPRLAREVFEVYYVDIVRLGLGSVLDYIGEFTNHLTLDCFLDRTVSLAEMRNYAKVGFSRDLDSNGSWENAVKVYENL